MVEVIEGEIIKDYGLNKNQFTFANYYIESGNATVSYMRAYNQDNENVAAVEGSKLLRKPKMVAFMEDKKKELQDSVLITKEEVLRDLVEIKDIHKETNPSAATQALKVINEMLGYNMPKEATINVKTKFDLSNVSENTLKELRESALTISGGD